MDTIESLRQELAGVRAELLRHRIYASVDSPRKLQRFMEGHVFAVWDFMSLVKRLQRDLTCVRVPWTPSRSPAAARFINEVVTSEESDLGPDGKPMSHFELYLTAMEEVGANTKAIRELTQKIDGGDPLEAALAAAEVPEQAAAFVRNTIVCAESGRTVEVASAFLFGREDVIPEMFARLLEHWPKGALPHFWYYLRRHVDLDRDEHAPLAERLLQDVAGLDRQAWRLAADAATRAIKARIRLWDWLLESLPLRSP